MSFLHILDVVEYRAGGARLLILWMDPVSDLVATVDLSQSDAWPVLSELSELEAAISDMADLALRLEPLPPGVTVTERDKAIRDTAWGIISPIVRSEPQVYDRLARAKMIAAALAEHGISRPKIVKDLMRYWHGGATPNALLPHYFRCGAPGVKREPGEAKRGRKRKDENGPPGININRAMRRMFAVAIQRFGKNARKNLKAVYERMKKEFFTVPGQDHLGRLIQLPKEEYAATGYPTFEQFLYHIHEDVDMLAVHERRIGRKAYARNARGLPSTSTAKTWGPGARFQIDATIADVYLVSRLDRAKIIGRPVLYIVVDVFSRMIVGLYIGLEGPSWAGAMMALANTVEDKVSFCARFGVTIEPSEWPCRHLGAAILGDRGEMASRHVDTLENRFNVCIEIAASQRPDWKGIVESRFNLLPAHLSHEVPGWVHEDHRARCGEDYRLDAVLDIDEFTQLIIELVIFYNNQAEITDYDREPGMTADGVLSIPADLWEWGIANTSGRLRSFDPSLVRFALMPTATVTVTRHGLRFKGRFYHGQLMLDKQWLARARQHGTWSETISYDPRDLDVVYLHTNEDPRGFTICDLTERSRETRGGGLWEVEERQGALGNLSAESSMERETAVATVISRIDQVVDKAIAKRPPPVGSKSARTGGIKENRQQEKALNRRREADSFRPHGPRTSEGEGARVIAMVPGVDDDVGEFLRPTAEELMKLRGSRDDVQD